MADGSLLARTGADVLTADGLDLLDDFELGPGGVPATTAYRCAGGRYTLWLGATEWPNGDPVRENDICTEEQGIELTQWSLRKFAAVVDAAVKVPIEPHERSALIVMAYNIGTEAFASCSVVARLNANPKDRKHAADAFSMWCKATNDRPEKYDLDDPYYTPIMKQRADGSWRWVGPDKAPPKKWEVVRDGDQFWAINPDPPPPHDPAQGPPPVDLLPARTPLGIRYCRYQRAFPGLERRHLSEACLFMGLQWKQACRKDMVSIASYRVWDPNDGRWEDLVRTKTELDDILPVAKKHPLPHLAPAVVEAKPAVVEAPLAPASVAKPEPAAVKPAPAPALAPAPAAPKITPKPVPPIADIPKKPESKFSVPITDAPYRIDPNLGLKPMEETERWQASIAQNGGMLMMRWARYGGFGSGPATIATFIEKDPLFSAAFLAAIGFAGLFVIGHVRKCYGDWRRFHAERRASQAMV